MIQAYLGHGDTDTAVFELFAHLAALAVDHGLTLCATDGDFARFHGLR